MARKKPIREEDVATIDDALDCIIGDAKGKFGEENVFTGKESEARLVGIYVPALCLRYLFRCNILPLSRAMQIVGTQESGKSGFLYEVYRWFRCNGGRGYHIENESKDSDALRQSILNYDNKAVELFISDSLERWQSYLTWLLRDDVVKAKLLGTKDRPGPGKTAPLVFGIDSLTAKASQEVQEGIEKRGYADRSHPVEALKLSSYLKFIPQKLVGWPFFFVAVNHLKPQKGPTGAIDYHVPGGYSVKFQETWELRMQRIGDITSGDHGILVKMTTQKNSLAPGRHTIQAGMRWFFDKDAGNRQRTYWDWNSATIELLDVGLKEAAVRNACMEVVDIHTKSAGGKRVWSKALDIPSDDPVPYAVAGAILEKRPDLLKELHTRLGILEYTVFKPGVDYTAQLKEAIKAVERIEGYDPTARAYNDDGDIDDQVAGEDPVEQEDED